MKHDFIDKYSSLNSLVHKLDPRVKIISSLAVIIIIVSEPMNSKPLHFIYYFILLFFTSLLSKLPAYYIIKRILVVMPFILMATLFYPFSVLFTGSEQRVIINYRQTQILFATISIFSKAFLSVLILVLLTSTEKFRRLLLAMRKLKMPVIVGKLSAILYRYIFVLSDEYLRTTRARQSRSPGKIKTGRLKIYGNQAAMIFLRSWERSQIIYKSMLSRGFTGEYPGIHKLDLRIIDIIFALIFIFSLSAIRIWL